MRVPNSFQKVIPPQRSFSIRLRRSRNEVKQQFVKNRRSGEFGYSLGSDAVDISDNTDDALIYTYKAAFCLYICMYVCIRKL